ncbi:MAG: molybdopterin oxidoreductase, partial [Arenibacter sp.]|nr:molybdopterin oxidoreductase [Arenibacter sp.]
IAQAEVKTIMKSSGEKYKKLRDAGKPLYQISTARPVIIEKGPITDDVLMGEEVPLKDDKVGVAELLDALGTFDPTKQEADNLQQIKGIGPQMEATLNQIGIFTFEQVARMTNREYELLDAITESFPGRAQRDDWAGQARILNNKK